MKLQKALAKAQKERQQRLDPNQLAPDGNSAQEPAAKVPPLRSETPLQAGAKSGTPAYQTPVYRSESVETPRHAGHQTVTPETVAPVPPGVAPQAPPATPQVRLGLGPTEPPPAQPQAPPAPPSGRAERHDPLLAIHEAPHAEGQIADQRTYTESRHHELDRSNALRNHVVGLFHDSEEIEFYKVLRTQIQQRTRERGWNTVMVTSPQSGDGKTLTVINLAITMAKEYHQTVLVVDTDFRKQNVHKYLGIPSEKGLIDYLLRDEPLKDLIVWPNIDNLTLISGGSLIRESTELLGSPKMKALVHEMKSRYQDRYVLFDVPPVLALADAAAFAPIVDCILLVAEAGKTTNEGVAKALEVLPKEKVLGFVLNRYKSPMRHYYRYD